MKLGSRTAAVLAGVAFVLTALPAAAQTWINPHTTPLLYEIVAIDTQGGDFWAYGGEDLAGDGLVVFKTPEKRVDFRTAYVATDANRFWARAYVTDASQVTPSVTVYVFIDNDRNAATGGAADATDIDPKFTNDPSPGGYEHVLAMHANGDPPDVWTWNNGQARFIQDTPPPAQAHPESGHDLDPLDFAGPDHGYVQANVNLNLVGLAAACNANIFVRSANSSNKGGSDLNIGRQGACRAPDDDGDGIPDVVMPTEDCTEDDDCPLDGVCLDRRCYFAAPCENDTDCLADYECAPDGRCIPRDTGACDSNDDCDDLVCVDDVCVACTPGGTQCGPGRTCVPGGVCVDGGEGGGGAGGRGAGGGGGSYARLAGGDIVQGGACACSTPGAPRNEVYLALACAMFPLLAFQRRRSRRLPHKKSPRG